jgi:hypothetical protein
MAGRDTSVPFVSVGKSDFALYYISSALDISLHVIKNYLVLIIFLINTT